MKSCAKPQGRKEYQIINPDDIPWWHNVNILVQV
jgi:hypothetical protein